MTADQLKKIEKLFKEGKLFDAIKVRLNNGPIPKTKSVDHYYFDCCIKLKISSDEYAYNYSVFNKEHTKKLKELWILARKNNIQMLKGFTFIIIPKASELGLLFNLYNEDIDIIFDIYKQKYGENNG